MKNNGPLEPGRVAVTSSGKLENLKYILHVIGPLWVDGSKLETKQLRQVVQSTLTKAEELKLESIAIPAISTGARKFPKALCAEVMINAVGEFVVEGKLNSLKEIWFTNFDAETVDCFQKEFVEAAPQWSRPAEPKK